ncbi:MAG: hypothetical protein NVSMB2_28600 [Chloroflexota bacterium]
MTSVPSQAAITANIERQLAENDLQVAVEFSDGALILSGVVDTEEARQAAEDIAGSIAPDARIDNQLDVETVLPPMIPSSPPICMAERRSWAASIHPPTTLKWMSRLTDVSATKLWPTQSDVSYTRTPQRPS